MHSSDIQRLVGSYKWFTLIYAQPNGKYDHLPLNVLLALQMSVANERLIEVSTSRILAANSLDIELSERHEKVLIKRDPIQISAFESSRRPETMISRRTVKVYSTAIHSRKDTQYQRDS